MIPYKIITASVLTLLSATTPALPTLAQTTYSATCDALNVTLSEDKNYYIFTATSSGDQQIITGYTFNFGDNQSYDYTFSSSDGQDHHSASATHTYLNPGTYTARVRVNTLIDQKAASATSDACKTTVTISPPAAPATELPNTGTNVTWWVLGAVVLGCAGHQTWLRTYKFAKSRAI